MKILTINLHCLQEREPLKCLAKLAQKVGIEGYDIVFLQELVEVITPITSDPCPDTGAYVLEQLHRQQLDHHYTLVKSYAHESWGNCREYVGILTRLPILDAETLVLSERVEPGDIDRRVAQVVKLQVGTQEVVCISTHLSWPEDSNSTKVLAQIAALNAYVATQAGQVLLAGDFNITPEMKEYQALLEAGWIDTYYVKNKRHDWTCIEEVEAGTVQKNRLDYIWSKQPLENYTATRVFHERDALISDHVGVSLEIMMPQYQGTVCSCAHAKSK